MYICIFPLQLSFCPVHLLFNVSDLPTVAPKWQKAVNDCLIIIPHIHTYRKKKKKSLTLKYTNIWIFKRKGFR